MGRAAKRKAHPGRRVALARKRLLAGVAPGAEATAQLCPECRTPSEGFLVTEGEILWHHFRKGRPCVRKTAHTPASDAVAVSADAAGAPGVGRPEGPTLSDLRPAVRLADGE